MKLIKFNGIPLTTQQIKQIPFVKWTDEDKAIVDMASNLDVAFSMVYGGCKDANIMMYAMQTPNWKKVYATDMQIISFLEDLIFMCKKHETTINENIDLQVTLYYSLQLDFTIEFNGENTYKMQDTLNKMHNQLGIGDR